MIGLCPSCVALAYGKPRIRLGGSTPPFSKENRQIRTPAAKLKEDFLALLGNPSKEYQNQRLPHQL